MREHERVLNGLGSPTRRVRTVEDLALVDALVLPGGESTTISLLAATYGLLVPLRERVALGMPVYGSCAGMILLADRLLDGRAGQQSIGGLNITVRRNAFGRQVDSFEADLDIPALGPASTMHAVFIRAPWVDEVGPGVQVLARVPDAPEAGARAGRVVAVRQGALLATAFHPELTGDTRIHRMFLGMVRAIGPGGGDTTRTNR